jgi:hypothetical protein
MGEIPSKCGWCDRRLDQPVTGRPRKWCSRFCRQKAYEQRRFETAEQAGREQAIEELRGRTYLA